MLVLQLLVSQGTIDLKNIIQYMFWYAHEGIHGTRDTKHMNPGKKITNSSHHKLHSKPNQPTLLFCYFMQEGRARPWQTNANITYMTTNMRNISAILQQRWENIYSVFFNKTKYHIATYSRPPNAKMTIKTQRAMQKMLMGEKSFLRELNISPPYSASESPCLLSKANSVSLHVGSFVNK